jgi:hypothetical protein
MMLRVISLTNTAKLEATLSRVVWKNEVAVLKVRMKERPACADDRHQPAPLRSDSLTVGS